MFNIKTLLATALVAGTIVAAAAPAAATVSFANFTTTTSGSNVKWKISTTASGSGAAGTGGTIFTVATPSSNVAGATNVTFNYLVGGLPTALAAKFTLLGTVNNGNAAQFLGNCAPAAPAGQCFITQPNIHGTFSFISAQAFTVGTTNYGIGTNLLTATNYTGAIVSGIRTASGGSAGFNGSEPGSGTVTYTSDVLDFSSSTARDFSFTLGSISPRFTAASGKALTNFSASLNGTLGSEPSPAVPEPATWALFVAGFGMVGFQVRRRRNLASVSA